MKKKGFTLVELLAVITVIAIIGLISVPVVEGIVKRSRQKAYDRQIVELVRAAKEFATENAKFLPRENRGTKYICISELQESGYLEAGIIYNPITSDKMNGVIRVRYLEYSKSYEYTYEESRECSFFFPEIIVTDNFINGIYQEEILNGAYPVLDDGMIPVTLDNYGNVKKADFFQAWYSYQNKEWANAVLVTDASRASIKNAAAGSTINTSDILAYLVWIPRYKYYIPTGGTTTPSSINIVFESKTTPKSYGNATTEYYSHPAFTFGDAEVDGIWVGKFETTGNATTPTVLPNVTSLREQDISTQFATAQKFGNYGVKGDAHMMKNSEWGATAYLSHSIYGINEEVRINNNSSYITGCGASKTNLSNTASCSNAYARSTSYPQSTTGNITGIFDTSGGAWEYVMGNYNNTISSSGFTTMPSSKYFDLYTTSDYETACNGGKCFGHAGYETKNWYSDYYNAINSSDPWVARGGFYNSTSTGGMFYTGTSKGHASTPYSFRLAFLVGA